MIRLSVNVNKIATLRNARGGRVPCVLDAVRVCVEAGAHGITVHPRADARHITDEDVRDIAGVLAGHRDRIEYNIEGDPRPDWLALVREVRPDQCTLVPVAPGELTSQAGWTQELASKSLPSVVRGLRALGVRVSLFVEPRPASVEFAADVGADRIELYTEPFASAFARDASEGADVLEIYAEASQLASSFGLGVNAGHDLDLKNLALFRRLPHLAEVSIGHALVSRAVFKGLGTVVREYLEVLS